MRLPWLPKPVVPALRLGRGCQGRPWLFADIKNAFAGSDERDDPTLGDVCHVVERHAELLTEFYDGDEQMAVHDLRKHIAWYLKGSLLGAPPAAHSWNVKILRMSEPK